MKFYFLQIYYYLKSFNLYFKICFIHFIAFPLLIFQNYYFHLNFRCVMIKFSFCEHYFIQINHFLSAFICSISNDLISLFFLHRLTILTILKSDTSNYQDFSTNHLICQIVMINQFRVFINQNHYYQLSQNFINQSYQSLLLIHLLRTISLNLQQTAKEHSINLKNYLFNKAYSSSFSQNILQIFQFLEYYGLQILCHSYPAFSEQIQVNPYFNQLGKQYLLEVIHELVFESIYLNYFFGCLKC
ncbi:transmembrane protein, putative (macronuclear) [Tetrahymena thermophila SB210]|uniref:Transmembrane protein, putative n=1 Tax=Tetrahymena thermophila (strain SB210) TaxID=312017 RepID=W7XGX5_TETTS|nr:transmembrane protein, putative [Tetrahymena thermophila SB210]EWS72254.1 transmembrane protein, putative [Tetrahymena thermophila SB210]|eukprot:XP_012655194.1 transmembrane protein, putative [Tetrahymena thermophila SB210]